MPSRPEPGASDRTNQPGAIPPVGEHAARPARVHGAAELQRPRDLERARRELPLALGRDSAGAPISTTRAREHVRRERGDRLHRVAAGGGAKRRQQISVPDRRAKPLTPEPESGTFVAESRPETAGARPAAARISTDDDRSGAREQEHAGLPSERADQS